MSTIIFTVNMQITISMKIYLFVSSIIQYEMSFLLSYTLRIFIFKFDWNVKHISIFSDKNHSLEKTLYRKKIIELHVVHTLCHM